MVYLPVASVNARGQPRLNLLPFNEIVTGDAKYIIFSASLENKELVQVVKRSMMHELVWYDFFFIDSPGSQYRRTMPKTGDVYTMVLTFCL